MLGDDLLLLHRGSLSPIEADFTDRDASNFAFLDAEWRSIAFRLRIIEV